jgi:NAD(P)-dependent dehydrogenase (short-subunit alcohol dehydrogenase family)
VARLAGKVAVITGATKGIGAAIARTFVAEGASVVIAARGVSSGESLAKALGNVVFIQTDVASEEGVTAAVELAVSRFGRLDCMINNVGFTGAVGSICQIPAEHWRATMAALLDGVFFGMKHAARVLVEQGQGGSILTTSSIAGVRGGIGAHPYTTAKHALTGLTRSVASELAPHHIRVNIIAPGTVVTPLSAQAFGGDMDVTTRVSAESSPMTQPIFPADLAHAYVYMASDEARHVTGQVLVVDGGATEVPRVPRHHTLPAGFIPSPGTSRGGQ